MLLIKTHIPNAFKGYLFLFFCVTNYTLKSQANCYEASFGLMNDKTFSAVASNMNHFGTVPQIDNRFSINGSLIYERKTKHAVSFYGGIRLVERKINYLYNSGTTRGFYLYTSELPVGLRFRKALGNSCNIRFNVGGGANYILTPDAKSKTEFKDSPVYIVFSVCEK